MMVEYFAKWEEILEDRSPFSSFGGMRKGKSLDILFHQAVTAIDSGDEKTLKQLLEVNPQLSICRLTSPGKWLVGKMAGPLKGFFKDPYLLWFVAEDPVRNGTLPKNIPTIASIIVDKARSEPASFQKQIDYALRLVAWSGVANKCGVQLSLIDVLIDAGAATQGVSDDALVNGNFDAAKRIIERGAKPTLATALCLEQWGVANQLALHANQDEIQFSIVMTSLKGKAVAIKKAISYGADINKPCAHLYSHGTPLHHAVSSGSLESVKVLVEAGANLNAKDTAFDGTPLGWAIYGKHKEIESYLREMDATE